MSLEPGDLVGNSFWVEQAYRVSGRHRSPGCAQPLVEWYSLAPCRGIGSGCL